MRDNSGFPPIEHVTKGAVLGARIAPYMTLAFGILAVLRLAKVIEISWWWVTAPIWGYFLIMIIFQMFLAAYDDLADAADAVREKRRDRT